MKSSSDAAAGGDSSGLVRVATGLRLRGVAGRMTARVVPGGVDQFTGTPWVVAGGAGKPLRKVEIDDVMTYDDKVVFKFRGIDSAAAAEQLVGCDILMPCKGLVDLPEGNYYIFELVGMRVRTRDGRDLGAVRDVLETGGTPLLTVQPAPGIATGSTEILLPASRSICTTIDRAARVITIDPPEGLLELYGL